MDISVIKTWNIYFILINVLIKAERSFSIVEACLSVFDEYEYDENVWSFIGMYNLYIHVIKISGAIPNTCLATP